MGVLATTLATLLLAVSPSAGAQVGNGAGGTAGGPGAFAIQRWRPLIQHASERFAIPEAWIVRVMRAESGGRTNLGGRPIASPVGAMGLMQLMPGTWADMRDAHGLGPDPYDPRDNILAGAAYLRAMYDRFGYPGMFAAYNAGPGRYARHLRSGGLLPPETIAYLARVAPGGGRGRDQSRMPGGGPRAVPALPAGLFVARRAGTPENEQGAATPSLFAIVRD